MFHDKWKDEALVIDKWFRVQATSDLPGALARVEKLVAHPAFGNLSHNEYGVLMAKHADHHLRQFGV